jgi:hypothetical protein
MWVRTVRKGSEKMSNHRVNEDEKGFSHSVVLCKFHHTTHLLKPAKGRENEWATIE